MELQVARDREQDEEDSKQRDIGPPKRLGVPILVSFYESEFNNKPAREAQRQTG
jgi:hypothetical protein